MRLIVALFDTGLGASYLQVHGPYPRVGLIANLTYVIVYYNTYNQVQSEPILQSALMRTVAVLVGVLAAILVSRLIFPFSTTKAARVALASMTRQCGDFFHLIITQLLHPSIDATQTGPLMPYGHAPSSMAFLKQMRRYSVACEEVLPFLPRERSRRDGAVENVSNKRDMLTPLLVRSLLQKLSTLEAYLCHMSYAASQIHGSVWTVVVPATQPARKDYVAFFSPNF